ncbi:MAG: phasin family protein [Pseudomonadota bacterium]
MANKATKTAEPIKADDITKTGEKMTASAREFVKRSAASAKERAESLHEGTEKFNASLEDGMKTFVGGYVSVLGGIANATFANVDHALSTVEKLAAAQSVSEAVKIQGDYVRESANANYERAKVAAEATRDVVMSNTSMAREQLANMWPYGKKAA